MRGWSSRPAINACVNAAKRKRGGHSLAGNRCSPDAFLLRLRLGHPVFFRHPNSIPLLSSARLARDERTSAVAQPSIGPRSQARHRITLREIQGSLCREALCQGGALAAAGTHHQPTVEGVFVAGAWPRTPSRRSGSVLASTGPAFEACDGPCKRVSENSVHRASVALYQAENLVTCQAVFSGHRRTSPYLSVAKSARVSETVKPCAEGFVYSRRRILLWASMMAFREDSG